MRLYPGVETPLKDKGPKEIDYTVVRENSGDVYAGGGGVMMKGTPHEVAMQNMLYTAPRSTAACAGPSSTRASTARRRAAPARTTPSAWWARPTC